jgi:DNA-binding CsgD family transcriptional regulator
VTRGEQNPSWRWKNRPISGDLSPMEILTLKYASRGLKAPEIADALGKSYQTVKTQLESARLKLNAKTTTQAVAEAIRRGLIP